MAGRGPRCLLPRRRAARERVGERSLRRRKAELCSASWPPTRRSVPLEVAIPGSVLSVEQDLRDKTYKVGLISRALAVFRVDAVHIYYDEETEENDVELFKDLLEYHLTPPHLRKDLFPIRESLRYAGLMPPLKLPNHVVPTRLKNGDVIDGLVRSRRGYECEVYLGRAGVGTLKPCEAERGSVVTVSVASVRPRLLLRRASWGRTYTGYAVKVVKDLRDLVKLAKEAGYLVIGTSKYGLLSIPSAMSQLTGRPLLVAFGGPSEGLMNTVGSKVFDIIINAIPYQGTESVRTEEALEATLALINVVEGP